jgi:hypothetical protein
MKIRVCGMDPSMRNWGIAEADLDLDSGLLGTPFLSLVQGEDLEGKQVRQNSSDVHLATTLCKGVFPAARRSKVIFVEVPVGSQSAYGMKSYGIVCGVLGALRAEGHEIIQVSALDVKEIFTGKKDATKKQMIEQAVQEYPAANFPLHNGKISAAKAEHCADAIAAIHAGVQTPMFQNLMRLFAKV